MASSPSPVAPVANDLAQAPSPWPGLSRQSQFFEDEGLKRLVGRALAYVEAGVPLHLCGAAGMGKTTIALRIAENLGRPVSFMAGNQWLDASDFIGREVGKTTRTVVDKYIQSVRRTDAEERADWRDAILADAMRRGRVLVYDEFTRASPEANSILLSVLEEGVLVTTDRASGRSLIEAHPAFRIILTSNPHDYIGVNGAPDALLDRMVTLPMPPPSDQTIHGILMRRTKIKREAATRIISLVNTGGHGDASKLRRALLIARIAAHVGHGRNVSADTLKQIATDVLDGRHLAAGPVAEPPPQKEAS